MVRKRTLPFGCAGFLLSFVRQPEGWARNGSERVPWMATKDTPWPQLEGGGTDGTVRSHKVINYAANRWAFKPELGLSQRWGHWILDVYGAGWFFNMNHDFFSRNQFSPGTNTQKQSPTFAFEGHLSYDVKPRFWASLDGNFWVGGRSALNGVENPSTLQRNSRVGSTVSGPVSKASVY